METFNIFFKAYLQRMVLSYMYSYINSTLEFLSGTEYHYSGKHQVRLLGTNWVQTVCKRYQQMALEDKIVKEPLWFGACLYRFLIFAFFLTL